MVVGGRVRGRSGRGGVKRRVRVRRGGDAREGIFVGGGGWGGPRRGGGGGGMDLMRGDWR